MICAAPGDEKEQLLVHDCSLDLVKDVRKRMPLQEHCIKGVDV